VCRSRLLLAAGVLGALGGCSSSPGPAPPPGNPAGSIPSQAVQAAQRRGRYELGCPAATGTISSQQSVNSTMWSGFERSEFTVVVSGCEKKATYQVVCTQDANTGGMDGGCLAASSK
jgi:hypothetical protein